MTLLSTTIAFLPTTTSDTILKIPLWLRTEAPRAALAPGASLRKRTLPNTRSGLGELARTRRRRRITTSSTSSGTSKHVSHFEPAKCVRREGEERGKEAKSFEIEREETRRRAKSVRSVREAQRRRESKPGETRLNEM